MSSKKKILIIEDDEKISRALEMKMTSEGYQIILAEDGSEGLKLALNERPDLILLDIVLPVMDGITVLTKLREDNWGKSVPVIILSNLSKADVIEESKEKGVGQYLVKTDWKLTDVVQRVKNELHN